MYAMPPYPYLATDYGTQLSLFTHHNWIGGFCVVGAGAHAAIFMVRDYDPASSYNNLLDRVIRHRDAIISHLNWVCIFLGFHSFGLYIHNDTMSALGRPQDMFSDTAIQLQPVFAQWIQNTHFAAPQLTAPNALAATSATWGGDLVAVGGKVAMMPISLGTSDFMVQNVVDHTKLRYMLGQLVRNLSPFRFYLFFKGCLCNTRKQNATRQNLKVRAHQQETEKIKTNFLYDSDSSETTREASFQFSQYYNCLPTHIKPDQCNPRFFEWFIGFFEADGSYSSSISTESNTELNLEMDSIYPQKWNVDFSTKRVHFEITQKDPKILYFIRKNLGYGRVQRIVKSNNKVYYRYYTSKKENIERLLNLFNGNLVLQKRQKQFEKLLNDIEQMWNLKIVLQPWKMKPSLNHAWLTGFVEGDGGFYTNQGNNFIRGHYPDGRVRYGFFLKFYITQKDEQEILINIRNLFQATNKLSTVTNNRTTVRYNRLEIANAKSRNYIIKYFERFPFKGEKKLWFERWKKVHGYQQRGQKLTEKSATKLKRLLDNFQLVLLPSAAQAKGRK